MKKFLILFFLFFLTNKSFAGDIWGEGELKLSKGTVDYFIKFIRGKGSKFPADFYVTTDGTNAIYWYCSAGPSNCSPGNSRVDIQECERATGKKCRKFAFKRVIKWKNGINTGHYKKSTIKSKWSDQQIYKKLTELGFYDDGSTATNSKKVEKKEETSKKVVKKYELKGKRSIALSWESYENLIAGTVEFDETDYKGTLNLPLPNNDGTCDGTYSLQEGGKGTWQIACTNNMGAAGTLKWTKDGGVTGKGRDHNDKKVKFTVSKES